MSFWNRDKEPAQDHRSPSRIPEWDQAQFIEATAAEGPNQLPIGWYIYQKSFLWHCLKPNETGTGFLKGYDFQTLTEAESWLGVPVPADLHHREENKKSMAEQLQEVQKRWEKPELPAAEIQQPIQRPPVSHRKRNIDIHIKVSPEEYALFRDRLERSGMTQTNFLLQAALTAKITIDKSSEDTLLELKEINQHLKKLMGDVGRMGGMLKMVIKPNEGQRAFSAEDWDKLIYTIQFLERLKMKIEVTMEAMNGYFKTHKF